MHALNPPFKLVLLPGMHGTAELFGPLIDRLGGECSFEVVSYPNQPEWLFFDYVDWVRQRLPQQAFVILAESFSSPIAFTVAAARPEHLCGLIICAGYVKTPRAPWLFSIAKLAAYIRVRMFWRIFRGALIGRSVEPHLESMVRGVMEAVPPNLIAARLEIIRQTDVAHVAQAVAVRGLLLQPSSDRLVPSSALDPVTANYRFERKILPGPHLLLQCSPELCADAIVKFIDSLR